jgi:hypothetical protein
MIKYTYGDFPTIEEIKRDYNELMEIIKDVKTINQAREIENKGFTIEINGVSIDEYLNGEGYNEGKTDDNIEWIRYENYGCLSYIYDRFDGKPMFDVWCNYAYSEFITDITIDELTEELYEKEKEHVIEWCSD